MNKNTCLNNKTRYISFMKIKRANEDVNINGTCLRGYLTATFNEMVEKFGEPFEGDGYKTSVEWAMEFDDGTIATIYDWKTKSPSLTPYEPYQWHIGGNNEKALEYILNF